MIAKRCLSIIIAISFLALPFLFAQQRVLLRINKDGRQESIPIRKGESAEDVLSRLDKMTPATLAAGTRDSLINFGKNGPTNFIASHQDVMFQWFDPQASGYVESFGWLNGVDVGTIPKSTIRAWEGDRRLDSLPTNAQSTSGTGILGNMGYYKKSDDGDGLKTPFKDEASDTNFVRGRGDSAKTCFDPLGKEAKWLFRGQQFSLVPSAWQSFKLLDFGDSMKFCAHQPFGFTKQNDTKITDIGGPSGDVNMLIGANGADQYPYHSIKFYEGTPTSNYGWQIRDYEWNMYVIVLYTTDRPPKFTFTQLKTTMKTSPRTVNATITGDFSDCGGGIGYLTSVDLYYRVNSGAYIKSPMIETEPNYYTGTIPGGTPGDKVVYYLSASFSNGSTIKTWSTTYYIFVPSKSILFMWNGRGAPGVQYAKYFMLRDSIKEKAWYDVWDVKSYDTDEVPDLLSWYNGVVEGTGDGGYADLSKFAGDWLATGTPSNPKSWFFSDQDHGFISNFDDTTFDDTDPHAKYFGVKALINQDYPYYDAGSPSAYVSRPRQLDYVGGAADPAFGFIPAALASDSATLWYNPHFEWGFEDWMDQLIPTTSAKTLFKDHKNNTIVNGVRNTAADNSWYTVWLAFDYSSVDFLSDTSKSPMSDPKYKWLFYDVKNMAANFIKTTTGVS